MRQPEFHALAIDEIAEAYQYLLRHADLETAQDFRLRVYQQIAFCHANPWAYSVRRHDVRRATWNGSRSFTSHICSKMIASL